MKPRSIWNQRKSSDLDRDHVFSNQAQFQMVWLSAPHLGFLAAVCPGLRTLDILIQRVNLKPVTAGIKEIDSRRKGSTGQHNVPDQYFSRAVGKALEILQLLQAENAHLGLAEITRRIGLTKASTFRLLRTLEISGYLSANPNGTYAFVAEFGSTVPSQSPMRLVKLATPKMLDLNRNIRETITLAMLFSNRSEVISLVESPEIIRMTNVVGHILPPNASSLGKAITAFQSAERREKLLRSFGIYRFTEKTITERSELANEYASIRDRCYATDNEETVLGGNCFGVPIFSSPGGDVVGAISMSVPKLRLGDGGRAGAIIAALSAVAQSISAALP
jgi:DNA-binding IclR family transcriptional regulator